MNKILMGIFLLLLSSCSVYKQQFDCPPPEGIPCASVTEIEAMILETESGADLLVVPEQEKENGCFWCGHQKKNYSKNSNCKNIKVWICPEKMNECDSKGYYLQRDQKKD
jgi:conjugal transfer pilus assembly protein TraV